MTDSGHASPFDDLPHDPERSAAQVTGLAAHLGDAPKDILDLGCGRGRALIPLAKAGHRVVGVDRDRDALQHCRADAPGLDPHLIEAEFTTGGWERSILPRGTRFDAVLILGNTLMTIWDVDCATRLLESVSRLLRPGGELIVDDIPQDFWPLLAEGQWCSGISADPGDSTEAPSEVQQLVWAEDDNVFVLRSGDQVDGGNWAIRPDEQRYRLWTMGELRLLARLAGLSAPEHHPIACLLTMRRNDSK